ncbi:FadR family transcriptional regulator [Tardiphaga sp. 37S4]|uniref:FadR/GntR family transcriptional regulator n=1 Tax=Tardiphaga sp. 37S4 TaxID=1404741 RepID=UPI001E5A799F|nr:FadR/GntR family transcriptional regulator [Tardiphaga sp. 37S4]UFS74397.1 FadR family transcriptional regulator [Tardiphaga sp. 37S4]
MGSTVKRDDIPERPAVTGKLSDRVYDHVLSQITVGIYPVNSRLPPETRLADQLGVSRPVVREALMRLRDDGVVASRQGAGSFVMRRPAADVYNYAPVGSIADIQRCFVFRIGIEGEAAALAARDHDLEGLRRIRDAIAALDQVIADAALGVEEDIAFHRSVAEATGNRFFAATLAAIQSQVSVGITLNRNLSLIQPRDRLLRGQEEHRAVLDAIASRDEAGAREAMRAHIENARKRVFEGG